MTETDPYDDETREAADPSAWEDAVALYQAVAATEARGRSLKELRERDALARQPRGQARRGAPRPFRGVEAETRGYV